MAAGLAMAFNRVHEQGVDLNGDPGKQFFTLGQPKVILGSDNTGAAEITAQFDLTDPDAAGKLTAQDYRIEFDGTDYTVTRVRDGTVAYTGTSLSAEKIDGLSLSVDTSAGAPQAGDPWLEMGRT